MKAVMEIKAMAKPMKTLVLLITVKTISLSKKIKV